MQSRSAQAAEDVVAHPGPDVSRAWSSLTEANRLLRMAEEMAHVGHWQFNQTTGQGYFSDEALRIFGFRQAGPQLTRADVLAAYHPDDHERVTSLLRRHIETCTRFEYPARIVRPDGEIRAVLVRGLCDRDPAGTAVITFGTVLDVTEMRRTEERLQATTALLTTTLDTMEQGLVMVDGGGTVAVSNRRASELLGLDPAFLAGQPSLAELRRALAGAGEDALLGAILRGGEAGSVLPSPAEERTRTNGMVLDVRSIALSGGGALRTLTDITERKRAEERVAASEARLRALTDALPQMVWLEDADGEVTYANPRLRDFFGSALYVRLADRVQLYHPGDARRLNRAHTRARATQSATSAEGRLRRRDGVYRWHKLVSVPVAREDGGVEWLSTALDIDEIVTAREALRTSEERLTMALDAGSDGLWDRDLMRCRSWHSERWHTMLGYAPGELGGQGRDWEDLIHPDDRERALRLFADHIEGRTPIYECEHRLLTKAGTFAWVLSRGKVVERSRTGAPTRVVGTHIDISARKVAEAQIAHMARHDPLTGLSNRTLFRERLDQHLADIAHQGGSLAVLCLDLDRFKAVNDTLGHPAGDTLLEAVARRLQGLLRVEDTVARLGGDEFAILQSGSRSAQDAAALARRVLAQLSEPFAVAGRDVRIGVSIGIAMAPEHGLSGTMLFGRADLALYRAKAEGRNAFRFFDAAMDAAVEARERLELDLRGALARDEFVLHYQPIIGLATGQVVGREALLRWRHPVRGLVSPGEFIPLAEETRLIVEIGAWALRQACADALAFGDKAHIAVNVSAVQFRQPGFAHTVLAALCASGLPPNRLELEITETMLMQEAESLIATLTVLRDLGVSIALDDFGTGYSSLSYLRRFPFDKIKIDRSFVADIANPETAAIVRAIVGLGASLGMRVTAEGVETEAQRAILRSEGCDEAQGYLIGRPAPLASAAEPRRRAG
ncbi:EAL domain-containing protein [Methylobacterium oryzisoli]|uniref:EAL domain-containing protein n=1 Tax=Methylobacterium oryzisoli TaxID=3385502 RepID=UPI0038912918